jgi:hypothetical protein
MPFQINEQVTLSSGVAKICGLVGLPVPADPAGNQDPNMQQIVSALNAEIAELYALRDWQELIFPLTISVVADFPGQKEKAFALPQDWGRLVDQTQWAQNQRWPAIGPIAMQGWATYLVNDFVGGLSLFWQIRNDQIWFLSPPVAPSDFSTFYISRGYVRDQDDPTLLKDAATKNGDTFLLDGTLMTLGGRLKWLEYKGFDTAAAARDFQIQYDSRAGSERGAPVLSMSRVGGIPLISVANLPQTGIGL